MPEQVFHDGLPVYLSRQLEAVQKRAMPRGVLRYISDGDVRSPFLGLKFAI